MVVEIERSPLDIIIVVGKILLIASISLIPVVGKCLPVFFGISPRLQLGL